MLRSERSHLEEWATLLEADLSDELLEEESETWVSPESGAAGDHAE